MLTMDDTKPESPAEPVKLSFDKFLQTELRVARIVAAERVEGTDKLLRLQLDVGEFGPRQIVAGIAAAYETDQLIGKRIVIVANLKPARIRGVESQGMLLAADLDGRPILATFDEDVPPGTRVR
jgi:methionyl-tRNA synthetase